MAGAPGRSVGKGNCTWDVIHKRRIKLKKHGHTVNSQHNLAFAINI